MTMTDGEIAGCETTGLAERAILQSVEATKPAGLVARFVGRLLDTIAIVVLLGVADQVFGTEASGQGNELFDAFYLGTAICLYEIVGVGVWGATPGKAMTGLTVRSTDDGRAGYVRALSRVAPRTVGYLILFPVVDVVFSNSGWPLAAILLAELAAFVGLAVDDDRRAWWDRLAGTVVRARAGR